MKKIINRKNAAAVACAAMMICAAGAVPDSVLNVSMPVQAAEAVEQTSLPQVTGLTSKTPDISSIRLSWNAVNGADGARRRGAELFELYEPHVPAAFHRRDAAVRLPDPAGNRRLGAFRRGGLRFGGQAFHGFARPARRRERLLAAHGPALAPAFAAGFGRLSARQGLVAERKRGALLPAAALYGARIQGGGCVGEQIPALYARRGFQRRCRMAAARPADRVGRGLLQIVRGYSAFGRGRDSALLQGQRLRRGGQRRAALVGRGPLLRRRGDGPLADSRQGQSRGFGHAVPQRIPPRFSGSLYRFGVGQPFRREPQRYLRPAAQLERRGAPERRGRNALYVLRCRKIVAGRGVERAGAALLRLCAL